MNSQERRIIRTRQPLTLALLSAILASLSGCGGSSPQSFQPKADAARVAMTTALKSWQDGRKKPGLIETSTPSLQVVDTVWASGARLRHFEIGPSVDADSTKKFTVKLTLEGASAPRDVVYIVVGKDPLWIFREQDFQGATSM